MKDLVETCKWHQQNKWQNQKMMFKRSLPNSKPAYTFLSSIFLLLMLNIMVKPLWIFAIDRQVQNIVGVDTYGKYFALFNITIVFNFLLDLGITTFYNLQASAKKQLAPQLLQTAILKFYLGIGYAVILVIIAYTTGVDMQLLFLLGLVQFLFSLFLFLRSHITAMQLFSTDAWLSVLDKSIMIISCGLFIYMPRLFGPIDITKFVSLQIYSILISICLALAIILKHGTIGRAIKIKIPFSILRNAWPYGLIVLVMSAINRQDAFLLERLHPNGDHEAGIYAGAYRLLDAANMAGYLVAAFLLPYISRNWNSDVQLKRVIILCRNLLLVLAGCVVAFIGIYAGPLQKLLYHTNNTYQATIIQLCIPALLGYSLVQIYGTVLTASGNIRLLLKLSIPFVVLNLVFNMVFIPVYGAEACCIIAIVTQLCYGMVLMIVAKRKISMALAL